jgi:prepilin-type N-terminal cleavage/methylation domain-containing protein
MRRAFTLIEMLTVILIILILVSIMVPVFIQVKARAKQTNCESNLHQVYLAIQLYENDYGAAPYFTSDDPDWKRYIGADLKCWRATQPNWPSYEIFAGFLDDEEATNPQSKHWDDLLRECRSIRGSDFPVAVDPNHHGTLDGYQAAGRREILVRESGSVVNVPFRDIPFFGPKPPDVPCSLELPVDLQF